MNQMICIWTNMNKTTICKTHRHRHDMLLVYSNAHVTHYMYIYIYCTCIMYIHCILSILYFIDTTTYFSNLPPIPPFLKRDIHPWQSTQADQKLVFQNHLLEDQAKPFRSPLWIRIYHSVPWRVFWGWVFLVPRMGKIPSQHSFFSWNLVFQFLPRVFSGDFFFPNKKKTGHIYDMPLEKLGCKVKGPSKKGKFFLKKTSIHHIFFTSAHSEESSFGKCFWLGSKSSEKNPVKADMSSVGSQNTCHWKFLIGPRFQVLSWLGV